MRSLYLLAFLAVAAARPEYHDDVFHFSTLEGLESLRKASGISSATVKTSNLQSGFQAGRGGRTQKIVITKEVTSAPAITQYTTLAQPAQQITIQKELSAPAFTQQYSTLTQPQQVTYTKQFIQPAVQQYSVQSLAQPIITKKVETHTVQHAGGALHSQYASQAQGSSVEGGARILAQTHEVDPLGYYRVSFQTENGIQMKEQQTLTGAGSADESIAKEGSYTYTGPDGAVYTVTYTADENGFNAAGEHLPTPPPIPAEILRALEINEAEGGQYDEQGFPVRK